MNDVQRIQSWMQQRGMDEKAVAAKLGITETGVRNQLKKATIKPGTLAKYAAALGVQIVDKREFVLLPAEQENALVDEILSRQPDREFDIMQPPLEGTATKETIDWPAEYAKIRPIPRAPTPEEIEAARKDWEAERRNGIAEAIVESETD